MNLDPVAFGVTSVLLSAVSGGFLLFASFQTPNLVALRWWGASFWLVGGGVSLLGAQGPQTSASFTIAGNALIALAFGSQYVGCRVFNERSPAVPLAFIGAVAWIGLWPLLDAAFSIGVVVMAVTPTAYTGLMIRELWFRAPHRLLSQSAIVFVLWCSGVYFALRALIGLFPLSPFWTELLASRWSSGMALL